MISMYPIRNDINNKILYGNRAMPLKDLTSDNSNSFSIGRKTYIKSYIDPLTPPLVKHDNHTISQGTNNNLLFGFRGGASINRNISNGASTVQKKWIGGNRDASQIIETQRINNIGNNSLNSKGGAFSMTSSVETNTVKQALRRTRNIGSAVPPKVSQKNIHKK
jgi:hypothetical protein